MPQVVGFVGAGRMGEPMVYRLIAAGHRLQVYARRDSVRERLRAAGATVVDSAAEAASSVDIVIACLFSDAQLVEVLAGPGGVLAAAPRDAVVVSHTTGTVSTVTDLVAGHPGGPALLDGPVSGSADDIAAGKLTVLLGGAADAVARVRPVLESYASTVIATGALGTALSVKLVNNALFAANAQMAAAALELGTRLGIGEQQLLDALAVSSGRSYAAGSIGRTGGLVTFEQVVAPFLRKDVAACRAATADLSIDIGRLGAVIDGGPLDLG
ncbi:NAD(P)-dependent oxidoreductase [Nocardia carnea]|uniref:NAD(P)-dependent oxidoreductase n=1 Tax=Nocardia carnea TaxID=37328 RepID=UPI0024570480|nr:NAD(P)-dependent oxidoreductase [Nocardia carnea]